MDDMLWPAIITLGGFLWAVWMLRPQPPKERSEWTDKHWPF